MDVLFYHLEHIRLEQVLPTLLEKSLERGWRACVKSGDLDRLEVVDKMLWTYSRDAFLPHGTGQDGHGALQPIYLTTMDENPNGSQILFVIEGAEIADELDYERVVYLFDGRDDAMLQKARSDWKNISSKDHDVTYWQQSDEGKWVKKA